jgi:hypothetical protein
MLNRLRRDNRVMDLFFTLIAISLGAFALKNAEQRRRITLLGQALQPYLLEKHMETLTEGYLRALGEADAERREQIWTLLESTERTLAEQFHSLATDIARLPEAETRISRFSLALPLANRLLPRSTFDLREAVVIHARGVGSAVQNTRGLDRRDKAFLLSAELYLFQHTCHWYCRSRAVASARLQLRHKTTYEQVMSAVAPATRRSWEALLGR